MPIAFLQNQIARLLGLGGVNADAAAAHLVHHRQQIDFEPVGVPRSFAVENGIEVRK